MKEVDSKDLEQIDGEDLSSIENYTSDFDQGSICGFLRVISGSRTDTTVEAVSSGCFRWVFSKNGRVTSISGPNRLNTGQRARGYSTNGDTVGINCNC